MSNYKHHAAVEERQSTWKCTYTVLGKLDFMWKNITLTRYYAVNFTSKKGLPY
jgi:hypothetical protein